MTRTRWCVLLVAALVPGRMPEARAADDSVSLRLFADGDDDDDDGVMDRDEAAPARARDVEWLTRSAGSTEIRKVTGDSVRIIVGDRAFVGQRPAVAGAPEEGR